MDLLEINSLENLNYNHWYYQTKFNILKSYLKYIPKLNSLIDIGAGSALFSHLFLQQTSCLKATAFDINYIENKTITVCDNKTITYLNELNDYQSDLVLMLDILEHIDDDYSFLSQITGSVDKGTTFFISVPAFQSIFSKHDVYLKHFRRYNKNQLNKLVLGSNLQILDLFYGFYTLFLPVALKRYLHTKLVYKDTALIQESDLNLKPNPISNFLLKAIHCHEPFFQNPFFGLACFCIAKKID